MDPTTNRINTIAKGILSHPSIVTFADYFDGGKLPDLRRILEASPSAF
jgi:hypothetical protein